PRPPTLPPSPVDPRTANQTASAPAAAQPPQLAPTQQANAPPPSSVPGDPPKTITLHPQPFPNPPPPPPRVTTKRPDQPAPPPPRADFSNMTPKAPPPPRVPQVLSSVPGD